MSSSVARLAVDTIRMLAVDAVEAAKSGHPGMPLGAAPMAYALWHGHLKHDPTDPAWADRDRFILSAGHGSMLLYALLHLTGYNLPLDELKRFRQWGSKTPGHPEYGLTPGVETTTGPLGQGFATGVGMALAEKLLAEEFNREGHTIVDHHTFGIVSDGDLMEGISSEAAALAGHLKLGKLIYLYDDNKITIEGGTHLAWSEDVAGRFTAHGWHVQQVPDGAPLEDTLAALDAAIRAAKAETTKPSLIIVRTHIGEGSPKADSEKSHGEPLGAAAATATRRHYNWPDEAFYVPDAARAHLDARAAGGERRAAWRERFAAYRAAHPDAAAAFEARIAGRLPDGWEQAIPTFANAAATREHSGAVLQALGKIMPALIGGSADLGPSTKTNLPAPRTTLHFGVREHAMGACVNGLALHGGFRPFGATFLVFADYMRPAVRLSALMEIPSVWVFTHDSLGVGEDGPTHQPVEHVASLRIIPHLQVFRPADGEETAAAWIAALRAKRPTAIVLTRQKLPPLPAEANAPHGVRNGALRGGYVLFDPPGARALVMATGSETALALEAARRLGERGLPVRVVSMPAPALFDAQPADYREAVLPAHITARVAVEAGGAAPWHKYTGTFGTVVSVDSFGASAPGDEVMRHYGFTVDNVTRRLLAVMGETDA